MTASNRRGGVGAYKPRRTSPCVCEVCKEVFYSTRYDAKTCGARCRKRLSRGWKGGTKEPTEMRRITWNIGKGKSEQLELWS